MQRFALGSSGDLRAGLSLLRRHLAARPPDRLHPPVEPLGAAASVGRGMLRICSMLVTSGDKPPCTQNILGARAHMRGSPKDDASPHLPKQAAPHRRFVGAPSAPERHTKGT